MKIIASIIIPNWNGEDYIHECLDSLKKQTYKNFEVIVVDNGSTDSSISIIRSNYPAVKIKKLSYNTGFAVAVNIGIKMSKAKYIVLMNNDTYADKNWLKALVGEMDKTNYGFAASKMLFYDKRDYINTAGDEITKYGWAKQSGYGFKDGPSFSKNKEIFSASGGSVMIRNSIFKEVGYFDEKFFAYLEDVDWCFRAQLMGYKGVFVSASIIFHHVSATTKKLSTLGEYLTVRNTLAMIYKNFPNRLKLKYSFNIIYSMIARLFIDLNARRMLSTLRGQLAFFKMYPALRKNRKGIYKNAKVDYKYIDSFIVSEKPFSSKLWRNK
ncbi:MAG: glycosyltransferase family 2 protein [Chitinophagia bacterium]